MNERQLAGSIGGHESWARTPDRTARTAPGRAKFEERFYRDVPADLPELRTVRPEPATLDEQDEDDLLDAADLVTYARSAVERDYRGDVIDAHAPEAPTRFAKMLGQIARGGLALGMPRDQALALALRVARDSVPPLRFRLLVDVAEHPAASTTEVTRRVQKPRTTVDRALQELHLLGLAEQVDDNGAGYSSSQARATGPRGLGSGGSEWNRRGRSTSPGENCCRSGCSRRSRNRLARGLKTSLPGWP